MADSQESPVVVESSEPVEAQEVQEEASGEKQQQQPERKQRPDPKPCDPPNQEEYDEKIAALDATIDENQAKSDAISLQIDQKALERTQARDDKKSKIDDLVQRRLVRDTYLTDIATIKSRVAEIFVKREAQRRYLQQMKDGLYFTNLPDLDAAISKIEFKLSMPSVDRQDTKKLMDDLRILKHQRLSVVRYADQLTMVNLQKDDTVALTTESDTKRAEIKKGRDSQSNLSKEVTLLRAKEKEVNNSIESDIKERKSFNSVKYKTQLVKDKLARKFQNQERDYQRWDEFLKYQKRVQVREERKERQAAQKAAYEAEQEGGPVPGEEEQDEDGEVVVPRHIYEAELNLLADLKRYCLSFLPRDQHPGAAGAATSSAETGPAVSVGDRNASFKGTSVVEKDFNKQAAINDEFSAVLGTKQKTTRRREKKVSDKLNLLPEVFAKFKHIGVETPTAKSQLQDTLAKLEERSAYYETAPPKAKKGDKKAVEAVAEETVEQEEEAQAEAVVEEEEEEKEAYPKLEAADFAEQAAPVEEEPEVEEQAAAEVEVEEVEVVEEEEAEVEVVQEEAEEEVVEVKAEVEVVEEVAEVAVEEPEEEQVQEQEAEAEEPVQEQAAPVEEELEAVAAVEEEEDLEAEQAERASSIALAVDMAEAERLRRVEEAEGSNTQTEAELREHSVSYATSAVAEEQTRRVEEWQTAAQTDEDEVKSAREASVLQVSQDIELERQERMSATINPDDIEGAEGDDADEYVKVDPAAVEEGSEAAAEEAVPEVKASSTAY